MTAYYHQQFAQQAAPEQVIIQSTAEKLPTVAHGAKPWSWCGTGWSVVSIVCCCPFMLCGLLGLTFSLASYADHKAKDYDRSQHKKNYAWGCTITAIVLGLIFGLGIALLVSVSPLGSFIIDWYRALGKRAYTY